jgi:hypothetical protein
MNGKIIYFRLDKHFLSSCMKKHMHGNLTSRMSGALARRHAPVRSGCAVRISIGYISRRTLAGRRPLNVGLAPLFRLAGTMGEAYFLIRKE